MWLCHHWYISITSGVYKMVCSCATTLYQWTEGYWGTKPRWCQTPELIRHSKNRSITSTKSTRMRLLQNLEVLWLPVKYPYDKRWYVTSPVYDRDSDFQSCMLYLNTQTNFSDIDNRLFILEIRSMLTTACIPNIIRHNRGMLRHRFFFR